MTSTKHNSCPKCHKVDKSLSWIASARGSGDFTHVRNNGIQVKSRERCRIIIHSESSKDTLRHQHTKVMATAAKKKVSKPRAHPSCHEMVHAAVGALKEKKGSSLAAIKKYIAANYNCDIEKLNTHIKNAVKAGVTKGTLVQVKGQGASGSFKMGTKKADAEKAKAMKEKAAARKKAAAEKKKAKREEAKAKKAAKLKAKKESVKAKKTAKKTVKKSKTTPKKSAKKSAKKVTPKKKKTAAKPAKKATPKKKTATKPKKKTAAKKK